MFLYCVGFIDISIPKISVGDDFLEGVVDEKMDDLHRQQ